MTLSNRVALITGAGSGIGKAAALLLSKQGARVAALDQSDAELKQVVKEIKGQGGEVLPLTADISQADQMQAAIKQIVNEWERIDIVFANAGINGV